MHNGINVVAFSFGQTSALMLRRLMDANPKTFDKEFAVIFENTGKEHDETLNFGNEVSLRWGVKITWLEYCRENNQHSFRVVDYKTAARRFDKKTPFDELLEWLPSLPNVRARSCSANLKVRTANRYLDSLGIREHTDYIGIRADEAHRAVEIKASVPKRIGVKFPLIEDGTTKRDVDAFWDKQPFRLNIPNYMGNCDLCFLKARWKRLSIIEKDPRSSDWWIEKERQFSCAGRGGNFVLGKPYANDLIEATHPQLKLDDGEDVPCSCAVAGYRDLKDEQ
jgi:3'-phosphoadenosine 5'-phosphosulfate sulfotransferase (PAPS reductase)/FAD synthetase